MAKTTIKFVCQECGTWHSKWNGKCDGCGAWNSLTEEKQDKTSASKRGSTISSVDFVHLNTPIEDHPRLLSGIDEFDRVCGGGLVPGSVILVGGDPGIGKSTLLLQAVSSLARNFPCAYVSGEEAVAQVTMRAHRLGVSNSPQLHFAAATNVKDILSGLAALAPSVRVAVIDSIQTMYHEEVDSSPGTVSQVRACTHELINAAKKSGIVLILVGHVTKEGTLAGPRVLEHMVDTVLYFEGERHYHYRILRSVKNRFGATDEIGVFEMRDTGLMEVTNPSALFLTDHQNAVSGSAIFAGMEGTRPILTEIQALVSPSYLAAPRRTTVGWDSGRLSMILAVLEARCGLVFGNKDVYLNVAGGLKVTEPAADLAVAAALVSALKNTPVKPHTVFFGEIGLAGEVRAVNQMENRLKEAGKLGFQEAYGAKSRAHQPSKQKLPVSLSPLKYVLELVDIFPKGVHNKKSEAS